MKRFIAWGDRHPIIYHAILFPPVGALGAGYELVTGSACGWALGTGTLMTLAVLIGQEWADQRAHEAIKRHHWKQGGLRITDPDNERGMLQRKTPEVWHGWDWRDLLGGVVGGALGAAALTAVMIL